MTAGRRDTVRPRLDELGPRRFGKSAFDLRRPRADDVAGQPAAYEHDEAVEAPDAVSAVGERLDAQLDLVSRADRRGHGTRVAGVRSPSGV